MLGDSLQNIKSQWKKVVVVLLLLVDVGRWGCVCCGGGGSGKVERGVLKSSLSLVSSSLCS